MNNLKTIPLSEIISTVIDYRGKTPKKLGSNWAEKGYRALSAKNVKTRQIVNEQSIRYVDDNLYRKWMKEEIQRGDILITSEAPFGQVFFWDSDEKIVLSQRLFALRCKKEFCSEYIFQYMTGDKFQKELRSRATGTTVSGLRQPELLKCSIEVPNYDTQVKIASTLGVLDRKIQTNKYIIQNLDEQISLIFNKFFLAKNSQVKPLGELVEKSISGDWGKESSQHNYTQKVLCIRGADINSIKNGFIHTTPTRFILPKNLESKKLSPGNLIIEISGGSPTQSTGRAVRLEDDFIKRLNCDLICTNFCKALQIKEPFSYFFYSYWNYLYKKGIFFNFENGTTGIKNLDLRSIFNHITFPEPNPQALAKFNQISSNFMKMKDKLSHEISILSNIRDTLLPWLISHPTNNA